MATAHRPDERGVPVPRQVVELRIHGAGGTPPEEILDVPVTTLVAGDESAGFFRPWKPDAGEPPREAYSWGGLTSASALRALWVLLLPFALANLAGWMLRHDGAATDTRPRTRDGMEQLALAATRVFGLLITMAVAAFVAIGAIDLIGYQCGARASCAAGRWWLSPWDNRLVAGHPGRAVAVGAAVGIVAILLVGWATRHSQIRIHDRRRASFQGRDDPAFSLNLNQRRLWDSPHVAHRLGLAHTAAALTVIGLTVAVGVGSLGGMGSIVGWVLLVLAGVAMIRLEGVPPAVHTSLVVASAVYTGVIVIAAWIRPLSPSRGPLPQSDRVAFILIGMYFIAALVLGVAAFVLRRRNTGEGEWAALVSPGLLLVATGLVAAVGAGMLIRLADFLGNPRPNTRLHGPTADELPPIGYPPWMADVAVVAVFAVLVLLAMAFVVWFRRGHEVPCDELAAEYRDRGGLDCADPDDAAWARSVSRARSLARLPDRTAWLLVASVAIVLVALAIAYVTSDDPSGLRLGSWADTLAGPASVIVGAAPLVAAGLLFRLSRSRIGRRTVGVLWDIATFWPRWFHPWAPPSYGERAVPQLGYRLAALAPGGVILSAHSQGSVLAVAALTLSSPEVRRSTALLTYGCPLTRLYADYFPEYLAPGLYAELAADLAGWTNLWRQTDFIGGSVRAPGVDDREVADPPAARAMRSGEPRPRPLRHSDYERTEEYVVALADLRTMLSMRGDA